MKKIAAKIISILSVTALALSGTAIPFAANAFTATAELPSIQTELVAPASYEQYLDLKNPIDVAFTNDYFAIADGNVIYVYGKGKYHKYEHSVNATTDMNKVTKLQFDGNNNVYFVDAYSSLYYFSADELALKGTATLNDPKFACSTFVLYGDYIYFTNVTGETQISRTPLSMPGENKELLVQGLTSKPAITVWNNEVYYTDAGKYLHKVNPDTKESTPIAYFDTEIVSMHVWDNLFISSNLSGEFSSYSLSELMSTPPSIKVEPISLFRGNYSSLTKFGDYVYAINGSSVCQYSITGSTFTDYEICNASKSVHRLNGGTDSFLCGETLFVADDGNARISVYDVKQEVFKLPIETSIAATYLAADEETVLVANAEEAILYDLTPQNYGAPLASFSSFNGNLIGVANVYGKYYFATDNNYYYLAQELVTETETGETEESWEFSSHKKTSTRYANLLTADAYGYLYIASGSNVYKFTEEAFLSQVTEGEQLDVTLPLQTKKILVDYAGGVHALTGGKLYKLGNDEPFPLNEPLVYSESATVQSFAFGIEDNVTYLLYEENYLAQTNALDLPTVKNIPVENADTPIFDDKPASFSVVKTKPAAMLVEFDLAALAGAAEFPYVDYNRSEESLTALCIGETDKHYILALYTPETRVYRACLALKADCEKVAETEYFIPCEAQTAYVSNDVPIFKFPHLRDLPTVCELSRNTAIQLLGEIHHLDYSYYYVSYVDGNGETHTGYIPTAYVLNFDPTPPQGTTDILGVTKWEDDGTWRFAFIGLGLGAICILADVLILRKKKDDE